MLMKSLALVEGRRPMPVNGYLLPRCIRAAMAYGPARKARDYQETTRIANGCFVNSGHPANDTPELADARDIVGAVRTRVSK